MSNNKNELLELKNSKEWLEFENYYMGYSIFNQFDFFRFEDMHTNILKSLFIEENAYGLGTYPLRKLIELLRFKDSSKVNIESDEFSIIVKNVETQKVIKKNRLDLKIDFKVDDKDYSIILENKVFSDEHDDQCRKYYEYFMEDKPNDKTNYIFVYLSLEKKPNFDYKKEYICINYQELVTYVIEPSSYKSTNMNPRIISLDTYLSSFSKLYEYLDASYDFPITRLGRELTINLYNSSELLRTFTKNKFYENNKTILDIYYYNILKIINDDDERLENDREKINKLRKEINSKLLNVNCTFKGEKVTYKKCYLLIVKYLFDLKIIKDEKDLDKLNKCVLYKSYVVATSDYDNLSHKDYYYLSDEVINGLMLNDKKLYYYVGPFGQEELRYFIEEINKQFNNVLEGIVEINKQNDGGKNENR